MATKPAYPIYLVSHTHWDREWYQPFERTRAFLLKVMDGLIDTLEHEPDFKVFYLDGQTIVIDDYLAIRPQQEAIIRKHILSGRLRTGPWYVAADVTLVSGEALVKNLRYGLRRSRQFGAPTLVGYMPDQFGHIAQMPQILNGFGITSSVVGRGRNRGETPNEFTWESPDGSQVLTVFLNTWYSNARNIPLNLDEAAEYLAEAAVKAAKDSTGPYVLLLNGCDHLQVDRHSGSVIRHLQENLGWPIRHTGLEEYIAAVRNAGTRLSVWQGEMREDQGGRLDAGTLSARMPLKAENFRLLSFLEGTVEPICAFVEAFGGQPDRDVLDHIWLCTLQNHPHDSICGCSIDEVAREMSTRTTTTYTLAEALAESELHHLAALMRARVCRVTRTPDGEIESKNSAANHEVAASSEAVAASARIGATTTTLSPTSGHEGRHSTGMEAPSSGYLMYQPAGLSSGWVHIANVDIPIGPSGRSALKSVLSMERYHDPLVPVLTTPDGKSLPVQVLSWERTERLCLDISHLPETQPINRFQIAFALNAVDRTVTHITTKTELATVSSEPSIVVGQNSLENQFLRVDVAVDGTINVFHKATGKVFNGLCLFEDGGDAGDTYHFVKPIHDKVVRGGGSWTAEVTADGPLLGTIVIRRRLTIPEALAQNRTERSNNLVEVDIELHVQLRYGSPFVECKTVITNSGRDHRLRVQFPGGPVVEKMRSLSAFAAVDRPLQPEPSWARAESCRPQLGWTSLIAEETTLTIVSGDLPEVEAIPVVGSTTLALTLLRCVGAVSRRTAMPIIIPAPDAQLLGTHTFSFAIYPHATKVSSTRAVTTDLTPDQVLSLHRGRPLLVPVENAAVGEGTLPCTLVRADKSEFVITAVEPAPLEYGGSGLVIRGWSAATEPFTVSLCLAFAPASVAYRTDLAGNKLEEIVVEQYGINTGTVAALSLKVNPGEIATVYIPVRNTKA